MENRIFKAVSWTLCTCVLMLCTGVITYEWTRHSVEQELLAAQTETLPEASAQPTVQTAAAAPKSVPEEQALEFYVCRMNGEKLGVYIHRGGKEEFLYNMDVDYYSLSEQDQQLLTQGVVLYNDEELTKFTEDFTS